MTQLSSHPRIVRLAKDLGLSTRGDCVRHIREHAVRQVEQMRGELPVTDLVTLRKLIAVRLRTKIEFIRNDNDIERIAEDYPDFHRSLKRQLREEFLSGETEGITLERETPSTWDFQFLAVIDARGSRSIRSYFTAWHELAHLLLHPPQMTFPGFRRTPDIEMRAKDPLESMVDIVAGHFAFYEPYFQPAITKAMEECGCLCFDALEKARSSAAADASLFATAIGAIRLMPEPTILISVEMRYKASEARAIISDQVDLGLAPSIPTAKLRVVTVVPNDAAKGSVLAIRKNMRVPERSLLSRVFLGNEETSAGASEDQGWWSTTGAGPLPNLPLRVEVVKRGRFVYGLVSAAH